MKDESIEIQSPENGSVKGVVLLTHGLNNNQLAMKGLANLLLENGYAVHAVQFAGHGLDQKIESVSSEAWLNDFNSAYCSLKKQFSGKKIYTIGYSLGAAVTLAAMIDNKEVKFDKMIFFAPAIKITFRSKLMRLLTPFAFTGLEVPSYSPKKYQAKVALPLKTYSALFKVIDSANDVSVIDRIKEVPTLVFLSSDDELVSFNKTKKWIQENALTKWEISEVNIFPESEEFNISHFLIVAESLGQPGWLRISKEIKKFIAD